MRQKNSSYRTNTKSREIKKGPNLVTGRSTGDEKRGPVGTIGTGDLIRKTSCIELLLRGHFQRL